MILRLLIVGVLLSLASGTARLYGVDGDINPEANQLAITSISIQGTNLVLTAVLPPGVNQVDLQYRLTLDASWSDEESISVEPGMTNAVFTIPPPAVAMCFFRLAASTQVQSASLVSSDLQYVTMPSLGMTLTKTGDAVFHFEGIIDGSDKIIITHDGALWSHINWQWPMKPVKVDGVQWDPREKNFLTTTGALKFLPDVFSLKSVDWRVNKGRDVVAVERTNNALIVCLDDTPPGASEYEFTLDFHPVALEAAETNFGTTAHLKIAAQIDGSDFLKITAKEATWEHKYWNFPAGVSLNGILWDPAQTNILMNAGTNTFLPSGVDLSSARIVSRKGRDLATMWAGKDALWVWFADNPNGSDFYELDIAFGR